MAILLSALDSSCVMALCQVLVIEAFSLYQFFLSKMLGTRYGPVGTRFLWLWGPDDNFRWF